MSDDSIYFPERDAPIGGPSLKAMFTVGAMKQIAPQLNDRIELANHFHATFDTPSGQIVLREILRRAGILSVALDPADPRFYDGKRALALEILDLLRWGLDELARRGITFEQLIAAQPEPQTL